MKRTALVTTLLLGLIFATDPARAQPPKPTKDKTEEKPKPPDPAKYEYVVKDEGEGHETMRIKGIGKDGDDDAYVDYQVVGNTVRIGSLKGSTTIKGVGEALKKEVLRRHPAKSFESQLVNTNYNTLLETWSKSPNGAALQAAVPAMKFKGFEYVITAKASATGGQGTVKLVMKPVDGNGDVKIAPEDKAELDKIVAKSKFAPKEAPKESKPTPKPSHR